MWIEVHLGGFVEKRILRPECDLEALGDGEIGMFLRCFLCVFGFRARFFQRDDGAGGKIAHLRDGGVLLCDEGIELRDLASVSTLLPFAKTEDVSHVCGAGAMEEPFVFPDDVLAQNFRLLAFVPWFFLPAERALDDAGGGLVAIGCQMDRVLEKGWILGQLIHADEGNVPLRGCFRENILDG